MRLGLYGGTFDPVHQGHLLLAESCREACQLDEVWFIPTGMPPHKPGVEISPAKARREMLELAVAGYPQFQVSRIEIDRPGPHFTVETLRTLRAERPDDELFLLIGADSLKDLPTWREPEEIVRLSTVVAVNRGRQSTDMAADAGNLPDSLREAVTYVTMPGIDLAASDLRERVLHGQTIRFQTPRSVEQYIKANHLYLPPSADHVPPEIPRAPRLRPDPNRKRKSDQP